MGAPRLYGDLPEELKQGWDWDAGLKAKPGMTSKDNQMQEKWGRASGGRGEERKEETSAMAAITVVA